MVRKIVSTALAAVMTVSVAYGAAQVVSATTAEREGSAALAENGGNRAYLEWYNSSTLGVQRTQLIYVYAEPGETIYFGSSVENGYDAVKNASIGVMMPATDGGAFSQSGFTTNPGFYVGKNDNQYTESLNPVIGSDFDRSKVYLFDADASTGYGYIADVNQEKTGPAYTVGGTEYNAGGYDPFSITVPEGCGGLWTFMYFSSLYTSNSNNNPKPVLVTDRWNQNTTTVAAWDATVVKKNSNDTVTQLSGRMACKTLFVNLGNTDQKFNADVYVLTTNGFLYNVDFNGADPYGFVFYANNRGLLLNTESGYQSLMHSAIASNNQMNEFSSQNLQIKANNIPLEDADETYYIFFNEPDTSFIKYITGKNIIISDNDLSLSNIKDIKFIGKTDTGLYADKNEDGYSPSTEGYGGTFTVTAADGTVATAFKISLVFTGNEQVCSLLGYSPDTENVVTLSNTFVNGSGTVTWDGRDSFGKIIPASEEVYKNIKIEVVATAGEIHLPFLDVENNPYGIKVKLVNEFSAISPENAYKVYYNNDNTSGAYGKFGTKKTIADGRNYSYDGVDSRDGAMKYTNGDGDQCAIDMWTNIELDGSVQSSIEVLITDKNTTSLTVTKDWNYTSSQGITDDDPPTFISAQLQQRLVGSAEWADYTGKVEEYRTPVTMVTSTSSSNAYYTFINLEWHNDDNAEYEYRVVETPITDYKLTGDTASDASQPVAFDIDESTGLKTYNQTIENTYISRTEDHNYKIYKYFYGYDDSAAGIFGSTDRYSAQNDAGYYYMNTEEAATLIYRVRQQEEGLTYEELPDTSSFTDVPNDGWGRKALEWIKNVLGFGDVSGARSTISSDSVKSVFNAHYSGLKSLDLVSADKVLRIDFLRAYNKALGRNSISEIYSADGALLCSRDSDGNYTLSAEFINNSSLYIFSSELPNNTEEIYQVLLACHSYHVSDNGAKARISPDLESERYTLDLGLSEAN